MLDFVNQEIKAGCTVCYAARRKSDLRLKSIRVTHVGEDGITGYNNLGHVVHIRNIANCVVVPNPER